MTNEEIKQIKVDEHQTFDRFSEIILQNHPNQTSDVIPFSMEEMQNIYDLGNMIAVPYPAFPVEGEVEYVRSQMCRAREYSHFFVRERSRLKRMFPDSDIHTYIYQLYIAKDISIGSEDELIKADIPWVRYTHINKNK